MGRRVATTTLAFALGFGAIGLATGCNVRFGSDAPQEDAEEAEAFDGLELADGTYEIEVETDSSMFRSEHCLLRVEDDTYTAILSLPGEGFSKLYFGRADDAESADAFSIYNYELNEEGLYTFELPVEELDAELDIAAYGQRRDTWYDHTIIFHEPTGKPVAEAE